MKALRDFHDKHLLIPPNADSFSAEDDSTQWSNKDLDPIPRYLKKWEWYHVGGFWIAEGFSVVQMQTASASVALGLNPGLALVAYLTGNIIVTFACCGSGYIGSKYSINFPVISRASFGLWGAYLPVAIRAAVCPIWFGIQAYLGSLGVHCMIEAIWPSFSSWHRDAFPLNADINAPGLLSFAIFWLTLLPFLFLTIPTLRWIFLVKIVIMPVFGIVLFTWALTASRGFGPLFDIPNKITDGMSLGYVFSYAITAAISGASTFTINMPDVTRYAHNPRTSTIAQAIGLPVCLTLTYLLGIVMAASSQVLYGRVMWNPLDIVQIWDNRAAKFFAGLLFAFANIGTNVAGNSIPFGNDFMALFPRYMNIRRGQYLCALIGFAICPWKIEKRATTFLAFLNGYQIFLGPIAGVLLCDFYVVRKAKGYNLSQLYKPNGIYWYLDGANLRAMTAFSVGMFPQLPGLIYQINPGIDDFSRGYLNFSSLAWVDAFVFSTLTYYALFLLCPFQTHSDKAAYAIEGQMPAPSSSLQQDDEKIVGSSSG